MGEINIKAKLSPAELKLGLSLAIKGNLKTKDNSIHVPSGTSRDHKDPIDEKLGHDMRAIMGAMIGPNVGLANFGSMIIRKVAEDADVGYVSKSTDETIVKIEEYNKNRTCKIWQKRCYRLYGHSEMVSKYC